MLLPHPPHPPVTLTTARRSLRTLLGCWKNLLPAVACAGAALALAIALGPLPAAHAQELDCLECHDDLTAGSVHEGTATCSECHQDVVDEQHEDADAKPVDCGACHDDLAEALPRDIHRRFAERVGDDGPDCKTCHGDHEIASPAASPDIVEDYCADCHDNILLLNPYHALGSVPDTTCLECHEDAQPYAKELERSVHDRFACADCHAYSANHLEEHEEDLPFDQVADCYLCHKKESLDHSESIHGVGIAEGVDEAANCWDCHGSHGIGPVSEASSPVHPGNLTQTCGLCHDDPQFAEKFSMSVKRPGKMYAQSVHGELVKQGRMDAANCGICHGVHSIKNRIQPGSQISSFAVPDTCGQCHEEVAAEYKQSIHWVRAKRGIKDSPVCNDCHSEHSIHAIKSVENTDSAGEAQKIQGDTCINCHSDPIIARRYNLNPAQAASYLDSYHGMAEQRGDKEVAMCVDCHGVHKILPRLHPESQVNPANVVATCEKCHENATLEFSRSYTHEKASPSNRVVEYWVKLIYLWVIWLVIGSMALHNLLIFARELQARWRRNARSVRISRFTMNEVAQHLLIVVSFLVLVVTGFALTYPDVWIFRWLEWLNTTETVRQYIHRTAGVVLIGAGIYHIVYLVSTRRGHQVLGAMWLRMADLHGFVANLAYYLGLRKAPPAFAEFDYTEKAEYWALIWGALVMGATGIVLWFPNEFSKGAPYWLIPVSEIVHFYEAVLATLAIVVWHFFFVIFHPGQYPANLTMVDGRVSLADYKHHHRGAFRRLMLDWYRIHTAQRSREQAGYFTGRVLEALEGQGHNPDAILLAELEADPELQAWVHAHRASQTEEG